MTATPPIAAEIADEAARLAVRVHSADATERDWQELQAWLESGEAHRHAFDQAERLWLELDRLAPQIEASLSPTVVPFRPRQPKRRWVGQIAAAASIVAALGIVWSLRPSWTDYRTAAGETRQVVLKDGSRIALNGATALSARGRDVRLHAGEAAFDVVHDARHPFTVQAGADQVRVLGTEFDVDRKPDTLRVTVRRGLVEVAGQGAPVRVAAGQQLERGGGATSVKAAKADDAFAWKQGRLVYDARPLSEVAADLTRRFPTPVRTDASAASIRFTGVLVLDNEAAVIARLEALAAVKADRTGGTITLKSVR